MRLSDLRKGDRVNIDGTRIGHVVGECFVSHHFAHRPTAMLVAIELDEGFYSEDRQSFPSIILAHGDSLELLAEPKED